MKNNYFQSITEKSKKTISRDFYISIIVVLISSLVYLHDLDIFKGMAGFSGFSSLRVGLFIVFLMLFGLCGWIGWFLEAKGKRYRFSLLMPVFMISYQLSVYLLNQRDTATNEFNTKIIINFVLILFLVLYYFYTKIKNIE